jgi:hypothetical protein
MVTQFRQRTLWDVIAPREEEFTRVLYTAIERALISLGEDIYKLDWCNVVVSMANQPDRYSRPEHELKAMAA